jgi:ankyrin repeat protein
VILLVQRDCDITIADNNGYLPAHHAAKHNKVDCLRFIVESGIQHHNPIKGPDFDDKEVMLLYNVILLFVLPHGPDFSRQTVLLPMVYLFSATYV